MSESGPSAGEGWTEGNSPERWQSDYEQIWEKNQQLKAENTKLKKEEDAWKKEIEIISGDLSDSQLCVRRMRAITATAVAGLMAYVTFTETTKERGSPSEQPTIQEVRQPDVTISITAPRPTNQLDAVETKKGILTDKDLDAVMEQAKQWREINDLEGDLRLSGQR